MTNTNDSLQATETSTLTATEGTPEVQTNEQTATPEVVKRGPGRPRIHPVIAPEVLAAAKAEREAKRAAAKAEREAREAAAAQAKAEKAAARAAVPAKPLAHSDAEEAVRNLFREVVGLGSVLSVTREVAGTEGEAPTSETSLVQVESVENVPGRTGSTRLHCAVFLSDAKVVLDWRDRSITAVSICPLTALQERMNEVAAANFRKAENERKRASRTRKNEAATAE